MMITGNPIMTILDELRGQVEAQERKWNREHPDKMPSEIARYIAFGDGAKIQAELRRQRKNAKRMRVSP